MRFLCGFEWNFYEEKKESFVRESSKEHLILKVESSNLCENLEIKSHKNRVFL
jgi:hypothetical protein